MARIIRPQKDILRENIENHTSRTAEFYSRWFEGAPTYVTYYKKNNIHSTQDIHLEDVKEVIGSESPILFDRIEDFNLYGFQQSSPSSEIEEYGIDWNMDSEAVILPNTIVPAPDDFFTVDFNGSQNLFRVTDVMLDRINGKAFYKIDYEWASENTVEIEEQIEDEYVFSYENLGTEDKAILPKKDYVMALDIDKYAYHLYRFYIDNFIDKRLDILYADYNGYRLYNRYLIHFIKSNKVLQRRYNFMDSVVINDAMGNYGYYNNPVYKKTIYHAIETMSYENLSVENIKPRLICGENHSTVFYYDYHDYYICDYMSSTNEKEDLSKAEGKVIKPHGNTLTTQIKMNECYTCDGRDLENIVIKYLNKELDVEELLNYIDNMELIPTLNYFLLVPVVIHILNEFYSELTIDKSLPNPLIR